MHQFIDQKHPGRSIIRRTQISVMSKEITYATWEEYLNGTLEQKEKTALETELQNDDALREQLAFYQEVRTAIQDEQLAAFKQNLQQAQQQYQAPPAATVRPLRTRRMWYTVAAVVAGLALLVWLLMRQSGLESMTSDQLYAQYAQHDIELQEMSSDVALGTIQSLLDHQQYGEALPLIETYLAANPEAADLKLAQAIALLETGKITQALQSLTTLENDHPIYANEARWYRALTYLKMENIIETKASLLSIPDSSSRYKDAQELLKKLP